MLPFQTCIRDVHAQSVMCAYNAVNGVPTCADPWLLKTLLRTHWNWTDGTGDKATQWVTSDCDSLANVYTDHRYKGLNAAQAAAISLNSGVDLDCGDFWPRNLGSALSSGATDQKTLDESLVRRYASLVRLGYFDPPEKQPYRQITFKDVATDAAKALALRAATEGIVLLKNAGGSTRTLPLDKAAVKTIAVLGPLASATTQMQGNYYGRAQAVISPAEGLRRAGFTVVSAGGGSITGGGSSSQAVDAVRRADAVVFVGGIDTSVEAEDKDRNDITWPSGQASLIKQLATAAAAAKKPFIVVQMGTMVDSTDLDSPDVGALLWAGYPGQDGGTAIANILTGAAAPAGRLPVTQYPAAYTRQVRMTDMNLRPSGSSNPG